MQKTIYEKYILNVPEDQLQMQFQLLLFYALI